jgi:hypothetical protein
MKAARTSPGVGFAAHTCRFSRKLFDQMPGDAAYSAALTRPRRAPGFIGVVFRLAVLASVLALSVVAGLSISAFWY